MVFIPFDDDSVLSTMTGLDSLGYEIYLNHASLYPQLMLVDNMLIDIYDIRPSQMSPDDTRETAIIGTIIINGNGIVKHVRLPNDDGFSGLATAYSLKRIWNDKETDVIRLFIKVNEFDRRQYLVFDCSKWTDSMFDEAKTKNYQEFIEKR